jgi:restriction endonuclease Mrr
MYSRGFFVSVNGYTKAALDILRRLQTKNLVLIDGEDLILVLNEFITFQDMIDRKVRAAQTRGEIYVHPVTIAPK